MPSQISGAQYIEIPTHDESLIGQYFNRELMEFQVVYYYAVLNSTGIVESTIFYTTQQTETNTLIAITYSQYSTVIGLYWNGTEFIDPPISIIAVASTNEISYKNEEKWLSTKLDEIEDSIENISLTPGADGKSAYQIAQDNGYTGTETEWLASLHGADGQDGVDGTNGTNGTDGADGQDGADGKSAYQIAVDNGFVGNETAWLASLVGATGAKGDKGDTGDAGQDGADGTTVAVGTTTTGAAGTNASVTSTYNSVTNTITLDFTIPRGATGESGSSASITADEVLTKIKTVDGANSGLDADTLDGIHASGFSASNHNHNGTYALYEHTHSNYLTADNLNGYATTEAMNTALSGKADSTHTHSNYASTTDVTALQTALNNKADSNHTHSEYASVSDLESVETALSGKASSSHTHAQSEVTGLASALSGKADSNHTHDVATTSANGFMSSADKTKLNGIETGANKTIVDASLSSTSTNPVQNKAVNTALAGKANTSHTHTLDDVSETDGKKIMTAAERTKLSGIANNANNYTLPTASTTLGGVKTTSTVSSSTGYTACPIISGVPYYKDTNTTYNNATASSAGLMSTADKTKLDGIATGANNYSLPTASASTLGGVKVGTNLSISNGVLSATDTTYSAATTSASGLMSAADKTKLDGIATGANKTTVDTALSSTSTNPVQNKVINTALAGKADSSHTHAVADITGTLPISKGGTGATTAATALTNLGITATAAELNKMDGVTATTAELNYVDGVTSNIQAQLNGKAASNHTHQIYSSTQSVSSFKIIYIATNGNDNNNGFTQTTPMATIKAALKKYADSYKFIDIRLADGTYTENIGAIAIDSCNLSIRSISEDMDKVTINMTSAIEFSVNEARMYNITLNVTDASVRNVSVNAGVLYAYSVRFNVPTSSNMSCVSVYNGTSCFLMNCVLNSGTGSSTGACVYGNQAMMIKAINCTSERTVATAFYANNGSEIIYSDTITATKKTKEVFYGKCKLITENEYNTLWNGSLYMKSEHTVTPDKSLSECRNAWLLIWSDYDPDSSTANDADFATTIIAKRTPSGGTWNGETFLCDIPRFIGANTSDVSTEKRIIKTLYVYNNYIKGASHNSLADRDDVVLRAIYEI